MSVYPSLANSSPEGEGRLEADLISKFRQIATQHAELPALCQDGTAIRYRELEEQSDRLAAYLRQRSANRETVVGCLFERGLQFPIALLGIWKAGLAYLPLDSENPPERLRHILQDAAVGLVLTTRVQHTSHFELPSSIPVLFIEDALSAVANIPSDEDEQDHRWTELRTFDPEALAVVLYTSGSTGQPKGVELTHRCLSLYLESAQEDLQLQPENTCFGITAFSFDLSLQEMLLPLLHGGRYLLLSRNLASDGAQLGPLLSSTEGRAFLHTTPITLKTLRSVEWPGAAQLTIVSGGEALHPALAKYLAERTHAVWNIYGPTETTIAVTRHKVTGTEGQRVPIGLPFPHCQLFVQRPDGTPCLADEVGELFIAGEQVGRGYRRRPDLTNECFVLLPTLRMDGQFVRTYRTGDLVSYDERGEFHIHGRRDNQVKMRGQRIELEEIELALAAHPGLREVAVVLKSFGDAQDDDRLLAFYATHKEPGPSAIELRQFVARSLPPYMVPSHFEKQKQLPKSVNGKIDRRQLGILPLSHADGTVVQMPATPTEEILLRFWREIPGFEFCGVTDNYFDLGGHSLLASKLFARIRRELGVQLPLSAMFTSPNIRGLARMIDNGVSTSAWSPVVTLRPEGHLEPIFLVHALGGNLLSLQPLVRSLPADHPLYGVQARGLNREGRTHQSIEEMAADYADSIVRAQGTGPYILIGYSAGGVVVFEVARRLLAMGRAVRSVIIIDTALNGKGEMFAVEPLRLLITPYFGVRNRLRRSWKSALEDRGKLLPKPEQEQAVAVAAVPPRVAAMSASAAGAQSGRTDVLSVSSPVFATTPSDVLGTMANAATAAGDGPVQPADTTTNMSPVAPAPNFKEPLRSVLMELRILARRIPFAPWKKLFPERLPDSFVIAIRNYRATPLVCDTVVFRAEEQRYPHATNASLGWDRVASPLSVYSIAGDHRAIMVDPQVRTIALGLEQHLMATASEQVSSRT